MGLAGLARWRRPFTGPGTSMNVLRACRARCRPRWCPRWPRVRGAPVVLVAVLASVRPGARAACRARPPGEHEAGADELAVEQHPARAALALLARVLRARQPEPLAQRVEQALARPDFCLALVAVDPQLDPHVSTRSSARSASTRSACRRYAAVPRTSSIGLAAAATRSGNDAASGRGHET